MRSTPSLALLVLLLLVALQACGAAAALRPQAAALNARGAALLAGGDLAAAEASFRTALEYNARFAEPHNNLGLVALARGHVREARAHFRAALRLNRDFAEAWTNLGVALSRAAGPGDLERTPTAAIDAYREALAIDPGLIEPRVNLVRALLASGRTSAALDQARRLSQLAEGFALAHALRATAALAAGRLAEATASATTAHSLAAEDAGVALVLARVDLARGAAATAMVALDALSHDPLVGPEARALIAELRAAATGAARADGDRPRVSVR